MLAPADSWLKYDGCERSGTPILEQVRFVSLWDMLQFPVWQLGHAIHWLTQFENRLECLIRFVKQERDNPVDAPTVEEAQHRIAYCRQRCADLELTAAIDRIDRLAGLLKRSTTHAELHNQIKVLRESIEAELKFRRFAFVPTDKAKKLDNIDKDWAEIKERFPSAKADIRQAVECYVLDCNTACVFHSMRVAEHGLRALARKLGLTKIGSKEYPLEFAEWGPILGAIDGKLKSVQTQSRSRKRAAAAKFYADAASHGNHLNEIWRRDVSHARGQYNSAEALNALTRTRDFMTLLVGRFANKKSKS